MASMVHDFKTLVFVLIGSKRLKCQLQDNDALITVLVTAVKRDHVESSAFFPNRLRLNQKVSVFETTCNVGKRTRI